MAGPELKSLAADWVGEYRGLEIGSPDSLHAFTAIEGLLDSPAVRTSDRTALNRHGEVPGVDWLGPRLVTLTIETVADTEDEFQIAMDNLHRAFVPAAGDADLAFRFPGVAGGGTRRVKGRVRARSTPINTAYALRSAETVVQLYCHDPRITGVVELTASTPLPEPGGSGGGLILPTTFPITFGPAPANGYLVVINEGSFPAFPRLRIDGPVSFPKLVNLDTNEAVTFEILLLAGDWLDVDTETHEVLLNGSAPRFVTPGPDNTWPVLQPGTSRFAYQGARLDPGPAGDGSSLALTWLPAWV